jgi:hypothetical protein
MSQKSVLYRAKKAVEAAILDVSDWSDMQGCIMVGLSNSEIEEPLTVRISASNFSPNVYGPASRGWNGQIDIAVFSQGDEIDAEKHAECCGRIEALVFQAPGDMETRIDAVGQGVSLKGAVPTAAADAVVDGMMVTRYGISGLWFLEVA